MKKSQVNAIFVDQVNRRNRIILFLALIMIVLLFSIISFVKYINNQNNKVYITYKEKSDIDYKVYLKKNDFFDKAYLEKDNKYIASIIDYINSDFNYILNIDNDNIKYNYKYRIEAEVNVKEKSDSSLLYHNVESIVEEKTNSTNNSKLYISENIKIDYNHFNDIIKKFIGVYDLDNIESYLNVNMYVQVLGECDNIDDVNKETVLTLSIPLTTKTVGIDIKSNLIDENKENLILCLQDNRSNFLYLVFSLALISINIVLCAYIINYYVKTRTAETLYQRELKKILNNYKSFIQKSTTGFNFSDYKIIEIENFTDMLEIRDTTSQPILMLENENSSTHFMIPSNTNILYVYSLKVSDIKKRMELNTK